MAGQGHTAILYIDANGNGMYFSYNPSGGPKPHGPAEMRYKELSPDKVIKLLDTGQIGRMNVTTGKMISVTKEAERPYDRFMRFNVKPTQGSQMFDIAAKY